MERLTRRTFIRVGAAASAAVVGGSAGALAASPRRKRVVIVGGGLAGLAAAHELLKMKASAEIVILEAQGRVGGRVLTVRSHMNEGAVPFADGQYLEAGAHRIPETHDRTLGYISELGLGGKVIEFGKALGRGEKGATMYLINNERFLFDEAAGWPTALGLSPTERVTPFFPQDIQYEYKWVTGAKPPKGTNYLGNPAIPFCGRANWPYGDGNRTVLDEWNGYTVEEFLASRGASEGWRRRLYAAENGTEIFSTTALAWVIQSALDWDWGTTYYLDGGLDQIPRGLATSVAGRGANLQLNSPVHRIEQSSTGATVTYRDPGGTIRTLTADRVVLTPTFTVLREKIDLNGAALAADKRHWINTLQMMPVTRISLQVNNRFWKAEGVEGLKIAGTDTAIERIWHSTNLQPGQSGIMQAYLQHQNALNAPGPTAALPTWMRDEVAQRLFPQVTSAWNGLGMAKRWHDDEWERGGWVSPKANQFLQGFHVWGRQEGRIHFAGDSTSLLAGWMQGGIESGQRAACEVAAAL
jgi:monoamine oxidase